MSVHATAEQQRLLQADTGTVAWKRWGPYLSERAWGTVREDYSPHGAAWGYFPHAHAHARAYRWNEDGLAGISDSQQYLCFALAFWNERDPILKERLFGLTGEEGNHGEDVKEYYFYLDSTPTHSFMRMLYKYPQAAFPYTDLVETNRRRGRGDLEYELVDTGVFAENRYFDIMIEYAKATSDDILIRISATNRGPDAAPLHIIPTLWFRNIWDWGTPPDGTDMRPKLSAATGTTTTITSEHPILGSYTLSCDSTTEVLFTENNTNTALLYGFPNSGTYAKDGINDAIVDGRRHMLNPAATGTKAAFHYAATIAPGATTVLRLRLQSAQSNELEKIEAGTFDLFEELFAQRQHEADAYYSALQPATLSDDECLIQRQAYAGMLWSKQFYYYDVAEWLRGDPGQPPPPAERRNGRNREWEHLNAADIISMPDTWEYPWFAAWDLAFHCIPLAQLDPSFAKRQLLLLGREWLQHPNGQIPAYEWNFSDVNPPVLAWAAWRVYKIEQKQRGQGDLLFLERVFHKLMLNFTWWVNRKDAEGKNIFQGGFLGLDNIGVFDRSQPLPTGGHLEQSDGTSWMGMFCLNMLTIALELATERKAYEDISTKFFEHFLYIADAMNNIAGQGIALWNEQDEFYYDVLHTSDSYNSYNLPLKIRSLVGLIPLFAVTTIEPGLLERVPRFKERLEWFLEHRPALAQLVSRWNEPGMGERRLLALCRGHRMKRILCRMLDETEFLSEYGIRSLSRYHAEHPYELHVDGTRYSVEYQPAESDSGLFGGNSNWRGPIWFPVNYLLIESLQQYHHYYGNDFRVECPTGSGQYLTLSEVADELSRRLIGLFARDDNGRRAVFGGEEYFQHDPHWRDYVPFYEYFHGDNGAGLGASHQTGWTGLVAKLIQQQGEHRRPPSGLDTR